ncbi:hypothetical protein TNCV_659211 [Trichonephila clavipes]|nr:hypothetical protein TNCV_659211 [Trichonephila clavipes]
MSARHHLSDYDRGRAVGRLEEGKSVTSVALATGVSKNVISRLRKAAEGGNILGAVGQEFLFWDDNVWSHRCVEISDTQQSENILRMQWPAYYPDLNLIDHT